MSDENYTKFYSFYLKSTNSLYALTPFKKERDRFLLERNPECFRVETFRVHEKIDMSGGSELPKKFYRKLLRPYPLLMNMDKKGDTIYEMLITGFEESMIDEAAESVVSIITDICQRIVRIPASEGKALILKDRYREALKELRRTHVKDANSESLYSTLNTFRIFAALTEFTFNPKITPADVYEADSDAINLVNILSYYCPSMRLYAM